MTGRSALAAVLALALVLAACADETDPVGDEPDPDGAPAGEAVAWRHLDVVDATLPDLAAAEVVTDADALADAWSTHGFEAAMPDVAFDDEVVLLLGRPDDACPDELVRLEVEDGALVTEWLAPPGACAQPLILWLHAVQVHRGVLAESFRYGPDAPFEDELRGVTLELPPYDGDAPPAPEPPRAMTDAELDEVFAGHPVQRCGPQHAVGRGGEVDGPLSDDPEVAAAQRARAEHGLPSDEATTRAVMDDPDALPEYGFPMLPEEPEQDMAASSTIEATIQALEADGWDLGGRPPGGVDDARGVVVPMIDRSEGIRAAVVVGAEDEAAVRELLDREVGPGEVAVVVTPWDPAEVQEAQATVNDLMGSADGPGAISWTSGPPGPVTIGMIDPTREALDAIAEVVDPELVCIDVELSGIRPAVGTG